MGLNVDIPFKTKIRKGCVIYRVHASVMNGDAVRGENCTLRHCVTIGNKDNSEGAESPVIDNNCDIGVSSVTIGDVLIGDNVFIGPGSVVVKDVLSDTIVAGNRARILKKMFSKLETYMCGICFLVTVKT